MPVLLDTTCLEFGLQPRNQGKCSFYLQFPYWEVLQLYNIFFISHFLAIQVTLAPIHFFLFKKIWDTLWEIYWQQETLQVFFFLTLHYTDSIQMVSSE